MKEKILKLRAEGKTYNQIKEILGCSTSTISYHCSDGQKEKNSKRNKEFFNKNPMKKKLNNFKRNRGFNMKGRDFRRRNEGGLINKDPNNFNDVDIINKLGDNPKCYLTGREINLNETSSYHFDHITPASKGGGNSLDNLGLLCKEVNLMKHNFSVDELLGLCKEILEYNGYEVINKNGTDNDVG